MSYKLVRKVFQPTVEPEGKGASVQRIIGAKDLNKKEMDPFLMLDYFNVRLPAGFPDHPHRGFETVTYMLSGEIHHEDFKGHKGTIGPGGIQWMTAGKGIMHAEIPSSKDEASIGFQLWINLRKKDKREEPNYQEHDASNIPIVDKWDEEGVIAKVIAGETFGVQGPIYCRTPSEYIDFTIKKSATYKHVIPANWNFLIFCYKGSFEITQEEGKSIKLGFDTAAFMEIRNSDELLEITGFEDDNRLLLIAGLPLNEPIAEYKNFVMNTDDEISETLSDYQEGENGFEGVKEWESEIKDLMLID